MPDRREDGVRIVSLGPVALGSLVWGVSMIEVVASMQFMQRPFCTSHELRR